MPTTLVVAATDSSGLFHSSITVSANVVLVSLNAFHCASRPHFAAGNCSRTALPLPRHSTLLEGRNGCCRRAVASYGSLFSPQRCDSLQRSAYSACRVQRRRCQGSLRCWPRWTSWRTRLARIAGDASLLKAPPRFGYGWEPPSLGGSVGACLHIMGCVTEHHAMQIKCLSNTIPCSVPNSSSKQGERCDHSQRNRTARRRYGRRLVFAAFAGETWDYMGSKRFLWELHSGSAATAGLSLQHIDQVRDPVRCLCAGFAAVCRLSSRTTRLVVIACHGVSSLSVHLI